MPPPHTGRKYLRTGRQKGKTLTTTITATATSPSRGRALTRAAAYVIIGFWLVMCAWFVRREVLPRFYAQPTRGYAALRAYARLTGGYRMGVYAPNGRRIGTSETTYQFKGDEFEISSRAVVQFRDSSLLDLALGPAERKFELWSNVTIGPDDALRSFRVACDNPLLSAFALGTVSNNRLAVRINSGGSQVIRDYPVDKDDLMSSGLMAIGAQPRLSEGQVWRVRMLDPRKLLERDTAPFSTGVAVVKRRTSILLRGQWYRVWEIELAHGGQVARSWVDSRGDVLKEESFGIVMIREPLPHERGIPAGAEATSAPAGM